MNQIGFLAEIDLPEVLVSELSIALLFWMVVYWAVLDQTVKVNVARVV